MACKTFAAFAPPALMSALHLAAATPAQAKIVKGPGIAVEDVGPAKMDFGGDAPDPDVSIARRRYETNLLAPVPVSLLWGMFVLKGDLFKEERKLSGDDAAWPPEATRNPDVAGVSAIFLPHASEGAPRFFLLAGRYGSMNWADDARPMTEFVVGADIADEDMPFHLKLGSAEDAESRLAVRLRRFPGFDRWIVLVGHKFTTPLGFGLDFQIPSYALVSWQTVDEHAAWKVYGGMRWVSREYPVDFGGGVQGWMDGHAATRLLGVRRHLVGPLYAALEGGMQKEVLRYIDEEGEELLSYETSFAPWGRFAVETWIETP